jgi:WD40 repeat protein
LLDGEREAHTGTGMPLLTPEYASPEQARGEPITVATDVYSLGAVFYEVLVGKPPQAPGASALETLAAICAVEPARPGVSRDLDSIALKALQKKPADRYASMAELIADLERFLDGRPVKARAASASYRAGKFVKRHAGKLAIAGAISGALVGAAVISLGQARRATEAARIAEVERNRLVFERGWQELAAGRAGASLPWLVRSLAAEDTPAVRLLLAEALRPFDREHVVPFPTGAIDARWVSDDRFIVYGRGGFAMFDTAGNRVGPSKDAFIWSIELGPDGSFAVAYEKQVVLYDAAGVAKAEFAATSPIWLGFLDGGSLMIAESNRLRLVRDTVLFERAFTGITCATTSRDQMAVAETGGRLYSLDADGNERWTRAAQPAGINAMRFASNHRLVTTAMDASVKVWSGGGDQLAEFAGHNSFIEALGVDRTGTKIATGGRDGTVKVWSLERARFIAELRGHEYGVTGVDFSADGNRLVSTGGDQVHRIWDLETAFVELQIEGRSGGGSAPSSMAKTLTAYWSPDGTRVLAVAGNSVKIVRADRGALLMKLEVGHQPRAATFGPGEREIAICGPELIEIRGRDGTKRASVPADKLLLWDITWSLDGSKLAYAGDHAALIDRATLKVTKLVGHPGRVNRVQFHDTRLLTAGDQTARIWDVASAKQLAVLAHPARVSSAIWDRAGTRIFTAASDLKVRIWDAMTLSAELDVGRRFLDLALSPDEHLLALAAHDGTIAIWDLATRTRVLEMTGHTGPVTNLAWSPDGALLASSADDQTARIWDPTSGKQLAIRRHLDGAMSVAWSADGASIITASTDGNVRIWDAHREARSTAELQTLVAP